MINTDDGRTMRLRVDDNVKYDDVVSGGEGMTMGVSISGGVGSVIGTPFMILKNKECS